MSLLYSSAATATVAANTNSITIAGMDLAAILPGMVINLGARDRVSGDGYIIAAVAPNAAGGGTLSTVGAIPAAFNAAGFVIDTRDFNGTAPNYLIAMYTAVLTTLLRLTSPLTNLFSGSRVLALDKDSLGAISRLLYAVAGRTWAALEQRTLAYTPTGGALTSAEALAVRAYPDGTTPVDALVVDLTSGGVDALMVSAAMAAASTVDLASAPAGKVLITGSATINSLGAGKHKVRDVHFQDDGAILKHNAASLILPTRADITVKAGDTMRATSDAAGNWRVRSYDRADGTPLALPAGLTPATQRPSFRNRIVNGDMRINQRGASSASTAYAAGAYMLDRWKAGSGGGTMSYGFFPNGDGFISITAGTLVQVIEGAMYVPEGGTYILSWGGGATARIYQGSATGAFAASPIVVTGLAAGTNVTLEFTGGSVLLPQFEPGSVATTFERRDDEERRCQRYFYRYVPTQYNNGPTDDGFTYISASNVAFFTFRFPVKMRATPTVSFQAYSAAAFASGMPLLNNVSPERAALRGDPSSTSNTGPASLVSITASAEL